MQLYNTLTRQVEPFQPLEDNKVRMYTCGPTVYNYAHIGNLRTYISEDLMVRTLSSLGYDVTRVMNVTDVGHLESDADDGEDKMLKGALRENKTVWEVAKFYTDAFFADCEKLNIQRPSIVANATDFIDDYIRMVRGLEEKGYTYFTNGNVYFDISKFPEYTRLSRMNLDELQTASREEVTEDANKRNPQDFVLWFTKSKFENQAMKWDSPWGVGYPGWHLECSAIALRFLGEGLDIHCGGVDHIPVHHTNEIAQTESFTGKPWVRYWSHMEYLVDQTGKMSKSKGEFLTLSLLMKKGYDPLAYRFFVMNSHYRKQLVFTWESLDMAAAAYSRLRSRTSAICAEAAAADSTSTKAPAAPSEAAAAMMDRFKEYIANDYNFANALTAVHETTRAQDLTLADKAWLIARMDEVLGLDLEKSAEVGISADEAAMVEQKIAERAEAKKAKDYARADAIRKELDELGFVLEDTKEGVKYKKK